MRAWRAPAVAAAVAEPAAADREPRLEPVSERVPDLVLEGIEEFNRGEFFEAHEYLEDAWREETGRIRYLYQGILQVGVGFYHQENGNWKGATGLLGSGITRLKEFEPEALGIDVSRLIRESESCLSDLEDLGRERVREFDRTKVPKVGWVR